jgi:hypothetical protein
VQLVFAVENLGRSVAFYEQAFGVATEHGDRVRQLRRAAPARRWRTGLYERGSFALEVGGEPFPFRTIA